ncbi:16S rRNA (adenine1518-N6/adenine1519-N6)-dimethyltransferase [Weissella beninensis]|uniref:Ribosomal RNA small subunit methyltransferase A n=1 Tax=Periweissella beninensis TaxID=504936 RepID=A0ABT0VJN3_9LACO|nr:16S rRNA (adenine(1518)-N(6)/adenine(1519)-N(6))-dimethyltransferase RsmA [Periweissella beninensis]MBM7543903.1 16S rRNA (adenine1518-N6/adenine1519-N6)-dimethyltransferase [Periweissella beninensis]MCM2437629.1 16S rRNA (adenine(1518)-N(6)/adenine(1519)-N(6))-dimethyltransferase RsmA [Periweissella beninensis]
MTPEYPEIATPVRTQAIMNQYGIATKKSLGQNFLTDLNILRNIVAAAELGPDDDVVEIGPGIGALTEQLAKNAHQVLAFEIDDRLIPVLADTLSPYKNVKILQQDILKTDLPTTLAQELPGNGPKKLVANLPYYITTPILMNVLQSGVALTNIVVMMQKEVAERLAAKPGTKEYGSLSIIVQYRMNAEIAFIVPKTAFVPQPNVDSAIVKLTEREPLTVMPFDEKAFFKFVKGSFVHRRKSYWNNLLVLFGKSDDTKAKITAALAECAVDPKIRAERLDLRQFITLTNAFHAQGLI